MPNKLNRFETKETQKNTLQEKRKRLDLTRPISEERCLKRPMTDNHLEAEEAKRKRLIGEDGRPRKKEVRLARQYGKDNPGLAGGWGESVNTLVYMLNTEKGCKKIKREKEFCYSVIEKDSSETDKKSCMTQLHNILEAETEIYEPLLPDVGKESNIDKYVRMLQSPNGAHLVQWQKEKCTIIINNPDVLDDLKNPYRQDLFYIQTAENMLMVSRRSGGASSSTHKS